MGWRNMSVAERLEIRRRDGRAIDYAAAVSEARQFLNPDEARELESGLARHGSVAALLACLFRERERKAIRRKKRREWYEASFFRGGVALPVTPGNLGLALHNANKAAKRPVLSNLSDRLYAIKEVVLARATRDGLAVFVAWHWAGTKWVSDEGGGCSEDLVFACHRIGGHTFHTPGSPGRGEVVVDLPPGWRSPRTGRSIGANLRDSMATLREYLGEAEWDAALAWGDYRQNGRWR